MGYSIVSEYMNFDKIRRGIEGQAHELNYKRVHISSNSFPKLILRIRNAVFDCL